MPPVTGFGYQLQKCADSIRSGDITPDGFWDIVNVANQVTSYGYDDPDGSYFDPYGRSLNGSSLQDAQLVLSMNSPSAWVVPEHVTTLLDPIHRKFFGKTDELDPSISPNDFGDIAKLRFAAQEFGIVNPYKYSLDALARKVGIRLAISGHIVADQRRYETYVEMEAVEEVEPVVTPATPSLGQVAPAIGSGVLAAVPEQRYAPTHRTTMPPRQQVPERRAPEIIRGQSEKSKRPSRLRRALAVAAIAVGVMSSFQVSAKAPPEQGSTAGVAASPSSGSPDASANKPSPPTEVAPAPTPDHIMSIGGGYDAKTRTGAIWFNVEDYAATLGHSKLTLLQMHRLTERCIQYMNSSLPDGTPRVPGGMSWDKASGLSSDAQLPYPPAEVMRAWIDDVLGQTGPST